MSRNTFKCSDCGRFVKYQDLLDGKARSEFVGDGPDEEISFSCAPCVEKNFKYWEKN